MKLETCESLCYSFLRHVKGCRLVQTNWKASDHWLPLFYTDAALEQKFSAMRENFDSDGSVFKKTAGWSQFLRQGEVDVVGAGLDGSVHAMEVAYHRDGLHGGQVKRVLKKLLRVVLLLDAYYPVETRRHIYFVSPKVNTRVQVALEDAFNRLRAEYPCPDTNWYLFTDVEFKENLLAPTLEKADSVEDTSELFVRAAQLLQLGGRVELGGRASNLRQETPSVQPTPSSEPSPIQPLVQGLMRTLLNDFPSLLTESDRSNLTDKDYCRQQLRLKIGSHALLRRQEEGTENSGRPRRHWKQVYADRYFVTSDWWKEHHTHNAEALLRWVEELVRSNAGQPGIDELANRRADFRNYLGHPQ